MRVVLCCSYLKGQLAIEAFLKSPHEIAGIVTHPEPREGHFHTVWNSSVSETCHSLGLPVIEAYRLRNSHLDWLRSGDCDLICCCNWRTILPRSVFSFPAHGSINVHEGLLPRYGGFSPVLWAMVNGEDQVGVTTHHIVDDVDCGDIIYQEAFPIPPQISGGERLSKTIYPSMARLLVESTDAIEEGRAPRVPQDLSARTFFPERTIDDNRIDWDLSPQAVHDLIRAQASPYPNAHFTHAGVQVFVKSARVSQLAAPGNAGDLAAFFGDTAFFLCGEATEGLRRGVLLDEVQPAEGTPQRAREYFGRQSGRGEGVQ